MKSANETGTVNNTARFGLREDSPAEQSGELFAIPDESCCSAEFPNGCILKDEDGTDF